MRPVMNPWKWAGLALVLALTWSILPKAAHSSASGDITLMQTMDEWRYPQAKMPHGARMSDGGNASLQSLKCSAVLTTPDPIEKVIAFYSDKLKDDPAKDKIEGKSVNDLDDSPRRPITLRVFSVNTASSSTSLVISRAEGEAETHIAWSHYLRLDPRK